MASSAAVSGWTAVLKELQQWQAQLPTAEQEAKVMRRVNKLLDQLGSLPAPAFKALVQEVQVITTQACSAPWTMLLGHTVPGLQLRQRPVLLAAVHSA